MRRSWPKRSWISRRALPALTVAVAAASVLAPAAAQAATGQPSKSNHLVNRSGTYNGQINQTAPNQYTGHIHFVVRRGKITGLRFTTGTLCGSMWAVDKDHTLPIFPVKITSSGAFSYRGTVSGRVIKLTGKVEGNQAHGTFFQSFPLGQLTCTMGQAAPFTATR
jgi:hypothetical protein